MEEQTVCSVKKTVMPATEERKSVRRPNRSTVKAPKLAQKKLHIWRMALMRSCSRTTVSLCYEAKGRKG